MIFKVWPHIPRNPCNSTYTKTYEYESIEQAKVNIIKYYGEREYMIKENPVDFYLLDVYYIENNELVKKEYQKQVVRIF